MDVTVTLDDNDWGQIVDGLTCCAEDYERTVRYYNEGYVVGGIMEVRDEQEAETLAVYYRRLIEEIARAVDETHKAKIELPRWYDLPFIGYLNAVDEVLEHLVKRTSNQRDLEQVAKSQEENMDPRQVAVLLARQ